MALIYDHNPSDVAGHDLGTSLGQLEVIRIANGGTWASQIPTISQDENVLYPGTDPGGTGNGNWRVGIAGPGGAPLQGVTPIEPGGTHLYAVRADASAGSDYLWLDPFSNPKWKPFDRANYSMGGEDNTGYDDERWWSFSFYVKGDMPTNTGGWHGLAGAHDSAIAGLFSIYLMESGRLWITTRNNGSPSTVENRTNVYNQNKWLVNEWTQMIIHAIPRTTATGTFEIWWRFPNISSQWEKIVSAPAGGWLGFSDGGGAPFWFQIMTYLDPNAPDWTRTIFFDRVRIGDSTSSFEEVEPSDGSGLPTVVPDVTFSPAAPQTVSGSVTVTMSSATTGVSIRYTTNGTTPTRTTGILVSNNSSVVLSSTTTLKAMAYPNPDDGRTDSNVTTGVYTVNAAAPLLFDHNPSDVAGHDISTLTGQLEVIRFQEGGTWNNINPAFSIDPNVMYPGDYNGQDGRWRGGIAGPNGASLQGVTMNEGTHAYVFRLDPAWGSDYEHYNQFAKKWYDRVDLQMGSIDDFRHGDERWYGFGAYYIADAMMTNDGGWHVLFEPHTTGIASDIASLFTIGTRANGRLWIYLRNGGQPSTVEGLVTVYDQTKWVINEWMEFVIHVITSTTQTGTFEVWFRRPSQSLVWEKLVDIVGNAWAGFTDGSGEVFSAQVKTYKGLNTPWKRTCLISRLRIGDENSSFNAVEPQQTGSGTPSQTAPPASDLPSGQYSGTQLATLTCSDSNALIRYTTDGTTPTETVGTEVANGAMIQVSTSIVLKMVAYADGKTVSNISSYDYDIIPDTLIQIPHRINCGSQQGFIDEDGNSWLPDQDFVGGGLTGGDPDPPANSPSEKYGMYTTGRWWTTMGSYHFQIPNGSYKVITHHNETWPPTSAVGARVLDIEFNNDVVLSDLDVYDEVGNDTALEKHFEIVHIYDESLAITFRASVNNPEIRGIEVLESPQNLASFPFDPPHEKILNPSYPYYQNISLLCLFTEMGGDVIFDSSSIEKRGTLTNGTWTTGKRGNSVVFDGSSTQLTFANFVNFNPDGKDCSFEFWVKPDLLSSTYGSPGYGLLAKYSSVTNFYNIVIKSFNIVEFEIHNGTNYLFTTQLNRSLENGKWNHLVCVLDRTDDTFYVYLNGIFSGATTTELSGLVINNPGTLYIGSEDSTNSILSGELQKVQMIRGIALSASEVLELYEMQYPELIDLEPDDNNFRLSITNASQSISNSLGLSGSISKLGSFFRSISNSLSIAGNNAKGSSLFRQISNSLSLNSNTTYTGSFFKSLSSSLSFVKSLTPNRDWTQAISNSLSFSTAAITNRSVTISRITASSSNTIRSFLKRKNKRKK